VRIISLLRNGWGVFKRSRKSLAQARFTPELQLRPPEKNWKTPSLTLERKSPTQKIPEEKTKPRLQNGFAT
jgi:hypothetical protein